MRISCWLKNLVIFCCLFSLIYWFYIQTKAPRYENSPNQPQEYMISLETTTYNLDGKPKESLRAQFWEFNATTGYSDLTKPVVTIYKETGEIWHLSANKALAWHATLQEKISKINMREDVLIERPEHNEITSLTVKTLALDYFPDKEMISSEEFVTMQQPGLTISGHGLSGYLNRNWIELHDKITTVYTPN